MGNFGKWNVVESYCMSVEIAPSAAKPRGTENKFHSYPFWCPRFWHGMRFRTWIGLLRRNRYRVSLTRWPMALTITLLSLSNSFWYRLHVWCFGRKIAATKLTDDPVFIIGHWRSGTTYLHELFVLDEQFTTPNTFECFMPHHMILSEWFVKRFLKFLIPAQRPMDNVAAGWGRPQEDEFALWNSKTYRPSSDSDGKTACFRFSS
jgi:hypothetical protein